MQTLVTPKPQDPEEVAPPRRLVAVVLNHSAGALLDQREPLEALRELFAAAGLEPAFVPLDAGTLPERVRLAAATGYPVIAAGGDGTMACAAQILAGTPTPMGILPLGTMNLLAKDLHLPIGDLAAAIATIAAGAIRAIDVGEVNGHVFLCASMLGLPARLARHREGGRGGSTLALWRRMGFAAWRGLGRDPVLRLRLRDGTQVTGLRASSVTVAANALDDPARPFGRRRLDAGELAIYITRRLSLGDIIRLVLRVALGTWRQDAAVEERRLRRLAIGTGRRAVRVMNDGEVRLLRPPLRYRIRPAALHVFAPRPDDSPAAA